MRESYDEGLASHIGPESCGYLREEVPEALTGVPVGVDIEPRNHPISGADLVEAWGRQHRLMRRQRRRNGGFPGSSRFTSTELLSQASVVSGGPDAVEDPWHAGKLHVPDRRDLFLYPDLSMADRSAKGRVDDPPLA